MKEIGIKIKSVVQSCKNTILENWHSGRAGKVFLVASLLIIVWLVLPLLCGGGKTSSSDIDGTAGAASCGGGLPTDVIKQYYRSFLAGDVTGYVSCVNYSDEEKDGVVASLSESFLEDGRRERLGKLYGDITFGIPRHTGDGKMSVKVSVANREYGGATEKTWYLAKVNGRWFIDAEMTSNPQEMGL